MIDKLPTKFVLKSKTTWFNLALASAVEISPGFSAWIATHPQTAVLLFTAANHLLRHFNEQGIHYVPFKKTEPTSPGPGSGA